MADALTTPGWHNAVMPSIDSVKSVFSSSVMARDVLKLYHALAEGSSASETYEASVNLS
jgi:hypothetical protein